MNYMRIWNPTNKSFGDEKHYGDQFDILFKL